MNTGGSVRANNIWAVTCKKCHAQVPIAEQKQPSDNITVQCTKCMEWRRYRPTEVNFERKFG